MGPGGVKEAAENGVNSGDKRGCFWLAFLDIEGPGDRPFVVALPDVRVRCGGAGGETQR